MKRWFNFARSKLDTIGLRFHYLRVGNTESILDALKALTLDSEVEWDLIEIESFNRVKLPTTFSEFSASIINLGIDDENVKEVRKQFWENYIWVTEDDPIPLALIIPDSNEPGSLTKSQVIESLSLVRLNDRPFEIFEFNDDTSTQLMQWLLRLTAW